MTLHFRQLFNRSAKIIAGVVGTLAACTVAAHCLQADEIELPPIKEDHSLLLHLQNFQNIDIGQPLYLSLGLSEPFDTISVYVANLQSIAPRKVIAWPADAKEISEFSRSALRARLRELGVEQQFTVTEQPVPLWRSTPNCRELHVSLEFTARHSDASDSNRLIAALTAISWQAVKLSKNTTDAKCAPHTIPPLMRIEEPTLFEISVGDRDAVIAELKLQILHAVDAAILPRVISVSEQAKQTLDSWQ